MQNQINKAAKLMWDGLKSQGFEQCLARHPVTNYMKCAYDGPNGKHCAIGWLVPGKLKEIKGLYNYPEAYPILRAEGFDVHFYQSGYTQLESFLLNAQAYHDQESHPNRLRVKLINLFREYNVPEIIYAEPNQQSSEADVGRPEIPEVCTVTQ